MDSSLKIIIVAAISENGVIGFEGNIPWHLSGDMKYFTNLTKNHTVIIGRKTHESVIKTLGHPLKDRRTIVITRQIDYKAEGCEVINSFEEAIEKCGAEEKVFVIGGAEIYRMALPLATEMRLTQVHIQCQGDTFFPLYDKDQWLETCSENHKRDGKNQCDYTFITLERKKDGIKGKIIYNLDNARSPDQRLVMQRDLEKGVCGFCPGYRTKAMMPILKEGAYWEVRENRWPYKGARCHLLFISREHFERLSELPTEAGQELLSLWQWAEQKYAVESGAVNMRFGNSEFNGATVAHLHCHMIVPDTSIVRTKEEKIRFRIDK